MDVLCVVWRVVCGVWCVWAMVWCDVCCDVCVCGYRLAYSRLGAEGAMAALAPALERLTALQTLQYVGADGWGVWLRLCLCVRVAGRAGQGWMCGSGWRARVV